MYTYRYKNFSKSVKFSPDAYSYMKQHFLEDVQQKVHNAYNKYAQHCNEYIDNYKNGKINFTELKNAIKLYRKSL